MARSHICIACGHDLARRRAPPDPHYQLPVVVCPACALACVRRPYAGTARWRSAMRVWRMGVGLVVRLVLLVLFAVVVTLSSASIGDGLRSALGRAPITALFSMDARQQGRLMHWYEIDGVWQLPIWLIVSVCVGVVVGLTFPHWRVRWWPIGVVVATLTLLFVPATLATALAWAEDTTLLRDAWRHNEPGWGDLRWFLWPYSASIIISWGTLSIGQRAARARFTQKGLRSRRLKAARKRRSRV